MKKHIVLIASFIFVILVCCGLFVFAPEAKEDNSPSWIYEFNTPDAYKKFMNYENDIEVISGGKDGYLRLYSTGDDCFVNHIPKGLSGRNSYIIVVYYRTKDLRNWHVYAVGDDGKNYGEEGTYKDGPAYENDGQWHVAYLNMSNVSSFMSGECRGIRFDFAVEEGLIDILFVAAFKSRSRAQAYVAEVVPPEYDAPVVIVEEGSALEYTSVNVRYDYALEGDRLVACKAGDGLSEENILYSKEISGSGTEVVTDLPDGSIIFSIVRGKNNKVISFDNVYIIDVRVLTDYDSAIEAASLLLKGRNYNMESFKELQQEYDKALAAGSEGDISPLKSALDKYRRAISDNPTAPYEEEIFYTETFASTYNSNKWTMRFPYTEENKDWVKFEDEWYLTNWVSGNELTFAQEFYEPVKYNFYMKIERGAVNGFGLKVNSFHDLFGGGRNCAGSDIGTGISVDLYAERQRKGVSIGFNCGNTMDTTELVYLPYPSGFDVEDPHLYTVYDYGNVISIYIDGKYFARIELYEASGVYASAQVFHTRTQVAGYIENITIQKSAGFCFYSRAGHTMIQKFSVSKLNEIGGKGGVVVIEPTPLPTADPGFDYGATPTISPTPYKRYTDDGEVNIGLYISIGVAAVVLIAVVIVIIKISARRKGVF